MALDHSRLGLGLLDRDTSFPNTDRPRPVNNICYFFPTEIYRFQENFTSASNLFVLNKGAVSVDEAHDRMQTQNKTLQQDF